MVPDAAIGHVIITGPMGTGKTTLGRVLAGWLGRRFFDSDDYVERAYGETGRQLARERGVAELHAIEAEALLEYLSYDSPGVIAAAASVADNADLLIGAVGSGNTLVYLVVETDELYRLALRGSHRRRIDPDEVWRLNTRRMSNAQAAGALLFSVDHRRTSVETAGALYEMIAETMNRPPATR